MSDKKIVPGSRIIERYNKSKTNDRLKEIISEFKSPPITLQLEKELLSFLFKKYLKEGSLVLDAGCSTGNEVVELMTQGHRVIAIDASEKQVKLTKFNLKLHKLPSEDVFVENIEKLDRFRNETFDAVSCVNCVLNYCDYEKALKRFHDLLKPGGLLIIIAYNRKFLAKRLKERGLPEEVILEVEKTGKGPFDGFDKDNLLRIKAFSVGELKSILAEQGYTTEEVFSLKYNYIALEKLSKKQPEKEEIKSLLNKVVEERNAKETIDSSDVLGFVARKE